VIHEDPDSTTTIRRLVDGYQVSQAIHVAAALGIADLLADASRTSDELAAATGTHPPTLYRLLRALASVGVLHELDGRAFELTPLGQPLRSEVPDSIAGWASFIGRPYYWQAWPGLLHSVRTGENAFRHVHGTDVWAYRSGADAYMLRAVIHDWDDDASIRILTVVRHALAEDGRVLIVERVIAPANEGRDAKFSDLNMLVGPGGRERTREEFAALLESSGWRLARVVEAGSFCVIEAASA
jgi:hypothetical protein